jgi:pimeloyl-ACP methyl ester carboxylesterase
MRIRQFFCALLSVYLLALTGMAFGQELRRSAYMGVQAAPVTDEVRARLNISEPGGVLVLGLVEGGSGKEAGLEPNDVITQIGDHHILDVRDFVATVGKLHAGDSATIRFFRSGATQTKRTLLKPRPFETSADGDTLYKSVSVDGSLRRVIVTKPKGEGRHPAILYVNGIGCFSQESLDLSSMDTKLLYGLTRAGFATMRVEKSGMGDSQGPPCMSPTVDLQAEIRGYVAGLKALKEYSFVDANQVFVVGLSIGGVEAPLVAQQVPVRGLVVVNTVAKPFLEYLMDTRRRQHLLRRTPYDEMERRLRLNEQCNHRLVIERETPDQLLKEIPDCGDYITYPAPYTYMQQWAAFNPAAEWKKVDAPVLVVYGTSDYISTIVDDPYLVDIINSFHPGRATIKAIPNMDHYLTHAVSMEESMTRTAGARVEFEPAVLESIKDWLRQQVSQAAPVNR